MPEKKEGLAGLLLGFKRTGDFLRDRTAKTGEDVEHLLDLHRMLETGSGGKAVLVERIFQEIEALRLQQQEMDIKLSKLLRQQQAMIQALNLPVGPSEN